MLCNVREPESSAPFSSGQSAAKDSARPIQKGRFVRHRIRCHFPKSPRSQKREAAAVRTNINVEFGLRIDLWIETSLQDVSQPLAPNGPAVFLFWESSLPTANLRRALSSLSLLARLLQTGEWHIPSSANPSTTN
jgi:hypothetical protein